MSIPVQLDELRATLAELGRAPYFLTVSDDGRPHCVAVPWAWVDDEVELIVGNRSLRNARARDAVSLVWPPDEPGGYSLIVDGTVSSTTDGDEKRVRVTPTSAVLHRPAPSASAATAESACVADCVAPSAEALRRG